MGLGSCQLLHAALFLSVEKFLKGGGETQEPVWRLPPWISGQRPLWGSPFRSRLPTDHCSRLALKCICTPYGPVKFWVSP